MKRKKLLSVVLVLLICLVAAFFSACGGSGEKTRLYPVVKNGKWGYINNEGKVVIEPQFDMAYDFSEGLALVAKFGADNLKDDRYGYIDETGKFVIEPKFHSQSRTFTSSAASSYQFSEGMAVLPSSWFAEKGAAIYTPEKTVCIDKTGKVLFELDSNYKVESAFSEGLLPVKVKKPDDIWRDDDVGKIYKYGYVDRTGKFVIEPRELARALPFHEGLAAVQVYGDVTATSNTRFKYGFIDKTGKFVIEPQYDKASSFFEGLAAVDNSTYQEQWKYIDPTGKPVIDYSAAATKPTAVGDFHDGLAAITTEIGTAFIDKSGKQAIPRTFYDLNQFSEGLKWASLGEAKFQMIDTTGKIVAEPVFPADKKNVTVSDFKGGVARVIAGGEDYHWSLIYVDKYGKIIWNENDLIG
jgi:hypothetical protein